MRWGDHPPAPVLLPWLLCARRGVVTRRHLCAGAKVGGRGAARGRLQQRQARFALNPLSLAASLPASAGSGVPRCLSAVPGPGRAAGMAVGAQQPVLAAAVGEKLKTNLGLKQFSLATG